MTLQDIDGWYYLHTNGALIFKRFPFRPDPESPFVRRIWPVCSSDRGVAWIMLIEALSLGANREIVMGLAARWGCIDEDAVEFVLRFDRLRLFKDGDQWCATYDDFVDLQESPAGFGDTALEALAALPKPGLVESGETKG